MAKRQVWCYVYLPTLTEEKDDKERCLYHANTNRKKIEVAELICCHKSPQTQWLQTIQSYYLTILGVKSQKSETLVDSQRIGVICLLHLGPEPETGNAIDCYGLTMYPVILENSCLI